MAESEGAERVCRDGLKAGGEASGPVAENRDVQTHHMSRRRPREATTPRRTVPSVAASAPGYRRRRRWRSSAADVINTSGRFRYPWTRVAGWMPNLLVNSLCATCYSHVNRRRAIRENRRGSVQSELRKHESSCVTEPLAITPIDDRGSNR